MNDFTNLPPTWQWAVALWLAVLGGCVGSFLNVVVYRLPAGKSLIHPGSFCPKCKHPIRWYDNVPVFGWLALRGKCRDCGEPISFRYPLVEAITAGLFFGLGWIELLSGGANLPVRQPSLLDRISVLLPSPEAVATVIAIYAFHLLLLCTLLAASLISYDKKRVPLLLFVPVLLVGIVGMLFWPEFFPFHIDIKMGLGFSVLIYTVIGLTMGWILGWLIPPYSKDKDSTSNRTDNLDFPSELWQKRNMAADGILWAMPCLMFLDGALIVLGVAVFFLALLNHLARWICSRCPFINPVIWLTLLVLIWLIFWRQIDIYLEKLIH